MGLSFQASNAIIYLTYGAMLLSGVAIALHQMRKSNTLKDFLSSNGTRTGIPLALNFIASAMGVGILTTYTQVANISGIQGLLSYTLAGAVPIFLFSFFGPIIRRRCPDGFVLTEWCYNRFGPITALYLSGFTIFTLFLFMVSELTAIGSAINSLTGLSPTPCIVIECVVTSIYTFMGGFRVSFTTDTIQAFLVLVITIIGIIGYSTEIHINMDLKRETYHELTSSTRLGWMIFYIMNIAILTNDCFMSGFWLRTFAAKTDKDLFIATSIAAVVVAILCTLVGLPGIIAVWTGDLEIGADDGYNAFFILVGEMHNWIIGVILVFSVALSTCTFDSLQSATASSISNDLFRNKFPIIYSRILVLLIMVPSLVVAIEASANVLQVYFIADLVSSSIIPIMFLGLWHRFYFLRGLDIMIGGLGALLAVFIYGCIYYGNAKDGGRLLLIWNGVYDPNDWGAFGAFVIAPFGGMLIGIICSGVRIGIIWLICKKTGRPFTALEKPQNLAFGVNVEELDKNDSASEENFIQETSYMEPEDENSTIKKGEEEGEEKVTVKELITNFDPKELLRLLV